MTVLGGQSRKKLLNSDISMIKVIKNDKGVKGFQTNFETFFSQVSVTI